MTMQSSGSISIGQAMNECQIGGRQDAGGASLSKLAGTGSGQRYSWSSWYGKALGLGIVETTTQYFTVNLSGSCNVNFQRNLYLRTPSGWSSKTGGDNTVTGNYPNQLTNGFDVVGFYRSRTALTVIARNCSLDSVVFQSSLGDNVTLTNDNYVYEAIGGVNYVFYGGNTGVPMATASRSYTVQLLGRANRPMPTSGWK